MWKTGQISYFLPFPLLLLFCFSAPSLFLPLHILPFFLLSFLGLVLKLFVKELYALVFPITEKNHVLHMLSTTHLIKQNGGMLPTAHP